MTTTDSWKENVTPKDKTDKTLVLVKLSYLECSSPHQVAIHFHQQLCILLRNNRRKYAFSLILHWIGSPRGAEETSSVEA